VWDTVTPNYTPATIPLQTPDDPLAGLTPEQIAALSNQEVETLLAGLPADEIGQENAIYALPDAQRRAVNLRLMQFYNETQAGAVSTGGRSDADGSVVGAFGGELGDQVRDTVLGVGDSLRATKDALDAVVMGLWNDAPGFLGNVASNLVDPDTWYGLAAEAYANLHTTRGRGKLIGSAAQTLLGGSFVSLSRGAVRKAGAAASGTFAAPKAVAAKTPSLLSIADDLVQSSQRASGRTPKTPRSVQALQKKIGRGSTRFGTDQSQAAAERLVQDIVGNAKSVSVMGNRVEFRDALGRGVRMIDGEFDTFLDPPFVP
jgi:hypothetical protein